MPLRIGFLIYPEFTQLDMTAPFEVFARMPETEVLVLAKTRDAVPSDHGLHLLPNGTLSDCPHLDMLCVPGGPGCAATMEDEEVLTFLAERGGRADYVTSVCTGSLVLAAAGLLRGYRATSHWSVVELLALCGAFPVNERVVVDRNRITGAGVTSGIDTALRVAATIFGDEVACEIQLRLEYDPQPPYDCGSPEKAPTEIVERARAVMDQRMGDRRAAMLRAAARLNGR
ncbi:MAG: DJ-1/PfpI family protein [Acidobacteriota bacterium]